MNKICSLCKQTKAIDEFSFRIKKLLKRSYKCRECQKEYDRKYYQNNKKIYRARAKADKIKHRTRNIKFITQYLIDHPCVDCGESDPIVLEFDHVTGTKYKNISKMIHGAASINKIKLEILKCVVRCANCHRRKTAKDFKYQMLEEILNLKHDIIN